MSVVFLGWFNRNVLNFGIERKAFSNNWLENKWSIIFGETVVTPQLGYEIESNTRPSRYKA
jgi:hypothetical protein